MEAVKILGIDPDLHTIAFAVVTVSELHGQRPVVDRLFTTKLSRSVTGRDTLLPLTQETTKLFLQHVDVFDGLDLIVVESQQVYTTGPYKTPNPDDIVILAHVTGLVSALALAMAPRAKLLTPQPAVWKAQVPKHIHQIRTYERFGWGHKIVGSAPKKEEGKKPRDTRWAMPLLGSVGPVGSGDWEFSPPDGEFSLVLGVRSSGPSSVTPPAALPTVSPPSSWKHIGDAVGLTLWGAEEFA